MVPGSSTSHVPGHRADADGRCACAGRFALLRASLAGALFVLAPVVWPAPDAAHAISARATADRVATAMEQGDCDTFVALTDMNDLVDQLMQQVPLDTLMPDPKARAAIRRQMRTRLEREITDRFRKVCMDKHAAGQLQRDCAVGSERPVDATSVDIEVHCTAGADVTDESVRLRLGDAGWKVLPRVSQKPGAAPTP